MPMKTSLDILYFIAQIWGQGRYFVLKTWHVRKGQSNQTKFNLWMIPCFVGSVWSKACIIKGSWYNYEVVHYIVKCLSLIIIIGKTGSCVLSPNTWNQPKNGHMYDLSRDCTIISVIYPSFTSILTVQNQKMTPKLTSVLVFRCCMGRLPKGKNHGLLQTVELVRVQASCIQSNVFIIKWEYPFYF